MACRRYAAAPGAIFDRCAAGTRRVMDAADDIAGVLRITEIDAHLESRPSCIEAT